MTMLVIVCNNKHSINSVLVGLLLVGLGYERWRPLSVGCLAGRSVAKSALEACTRRCAIQIKTFAFYLTFTRDSRYCI